jgi:hypothetical protein
MAMNLAAAMAPPPPVQPRVNPIYYVLAATIVAIGGIVAFVQLRGTAPQGGAQPPATASANGASSSLVAPPSAPSAPAPPPEPTAVLHVESEPPGAKVREDFKILCQTTPCDITYTGAQADPSVEHLLTVIKPNYKIEKRLVHVNGDPLVVKMTKD